MTCRLLKNVIKKNTSSPGKGLCPRHFGLLRILIGVSRNDNTTGNYGNELIMNNQLQISSEVFSILREIAGNQQLYINVTQ